MLHFYRTAFRVVIYGCVAIGITFFGGCSSSSSRTYKIELDPGWPSLDLNFKTAQVTGLTLDLLEELATDENLSLRQVNGFEFELLKDLKEKRCDAAILFIIPHGYDLKEFDFSPIYLETGPVLVTRSTEKNVKTMAGKEIAAFSEDDMIILAKSYPEAIFRPHMMVPKALGEVASHLLDGVILPRLIAESYCKDLYQGMLKVSSEPLREEGLRMVTRKEDSSKLQRLFTKQIKSWNRSSQSDKALQKWNLGEP